MPHVSDCLLTQWVMLASYKHITYASSALKACLILEMSDWHQAVEMSKPLFCAGLSQPQTTKEYFIFGT